MANSNSNSNSNCSNSSNSNIAEKRRSLSPADGEEVRIIGIGEYKQAAQCLADAFATDSVARYFVDVPDSNRTEEKKWALHVKNLEYVVAAHCYNGMVTTVGPDHDAVALWMPQGKNMDDWWTILRSGLWRLYFMYSREARSRFYGEFLPLLHHTKHEVMGERDDKSLYLVYIGTKSSSRGKGYAKKLIEHGLGMADAAGIPTYLESSADCNEPYYKKFGFELKKHIVLQRAEKPIRLGIMVREPTPTAVQGSSKLKSGLPIMSQLE